MTSAEIDQRVADFVAACRREGVKATHQRSEVLRVLAASDEHLDADTVFRRVRKRIPAISLDTVYRTLRLLEEKGVIARVGSLTERARFDSNTVRHHHFVCADCGLIGDFHSDELDRFSAPFEVPRLGTVNAVYVEFRGRCRACQAKTSRPA